MIDAEDAAPDDRVPVWTQPPAWAAWELVAVILVAGLGFFLRYHDYNLAPLPGDNWDELAWAWAGLTLITQHVPISWSYLPSYQPTQLAAFGTVFPIVHPYLDHPPLFNLLVGGYAWLRGARDILDVTPEMIRPLAVVLSTLSLVLIHGLGRRVVGAAPAIIAMALLATAPVAVLLGRQVESEALLTPLLLVALILTHRLLTGEGGRWALAGLVLACIAASLTKVPGIAIAMAAATILLASGRWRPATLAATGGVVGLLLYFAYGALIDWGQFMAVLHDQEARRHGVMAAYEFIAAPAGVGRSIRDGWWILGWIGLGALLAGRAQAAARILAWSALIFTLGIMLLADERLVPRFGWYRVPVYPLVYSGAAYLVWLALRRASFGATLAILLLGGATAATLAVGGIPWQPSAVVLALVVAVPLLPAVLSAARPDVTRLRVVARTAVGAALATILVLNVLESFQLAQIYFRI